MRTSAPELLPIFRSQLQGELLAATLLEIERRESVSDLARRLGANVATVQREVSRLERVGILTTHRLGRTRLVGPNTASPLYGPLAELVLKAFGPAYVVGHEFAEIEGAEEIYIFGSWAARYEGIEGPPPADVDVLVVGRPDRDAVHDAALRSEERLGRRVNALVRSKHDWKSASDGFVRQVRSSPLVRVLGMDET